MSNISIPTAARIIRAANPDIGQAVAMTWAWQAYREAQAQQEERAAAARAAFFITRREAVRGERYLTREFMQAEWDHIWTKTWQLVARVEDFPEPGAFVVHELG